jgi:hypothetical protein
MTQHGLENLKALYCDTSDCRKSESIYVWAGENTVEVNPTNLHRPSPFKCFIVKSHHKSILEKYSLK